MWIVDVESFPMVNNKPQQFVSARLANAILGDEIPDARDIMLVSIAEPCGLLSHVRKKKRSRSGSGVLNCCAIWKPSAAK